MTAAPRSGARHTWDQFRRSRPALEALMIAFHARRFGRAIFVANAHAVSNHVGMTIHVAGASCRRVKAGGGLEHDAFAVALTTLTDGIRMEELAAVAAALQTQVTSDFAPLWCAHGIITAAPFEAIQAGYCPVIVQDTLETEGAWGFTAPKAMRLRISCCHTDHPGRWWPATRSCKCWLIPPGPAGGRGPRRMPGQGLVEYLIDACAPCQDIASAYAIDGVVVSDFCTPDFFAGSAASGPSRSFAGALREVLRPAPERPANLAGGRSSVVSVAGR